MKLFILKKRESLPPLNIPTSTPAPAPLLGDTSDLGGHGTRVILGETQMVSISARIASHTQHGSSHDTAPEPSDRAQDSGQQTQATASSMPAHHSGSCLTRRLACFGLLAWLSLLPNLGRNNNEQLPLWTRTFAVVAQHSPAIPIR